MEKTQRNFIPLMRIIKVFYFMVALLPAAAAVSRADAGFAARCSSFTAVNVDISSLSQFFGSLPPDEKEEQLRDWAMYGLLSSLGVKQGEAGEAVGGLPMRYQSQRKKYAYAVLPGRIAVPVSGECVMLVPAKERDNYLLQGYIFDDERIYLGSIPERAHIFGYEADQAAGRIELAYIRTVKGRDLLSQAYGYAETEIRDAAGLKDFLSVSDDVTCVKFKDGAVVLGGRRNRFSAAASAGLKDVAQLYQAYVKYYPEEQEKARRESYENYIQQEYARILKRDAGLRKAIKERKITYSKIISEIKSKVPYASLEDLDSNVGFSLDPLFDFKGMADDIRKLASKTDKYADIASDPELSVFIGSKAAELNGLADKLEKREDITALFGFRKNVKDAVSMPERQLGSLLQDIELQNSYQTARYDGKMKGTGPAMTLFYTDLIAKLWAMDFNNTAPRDKITGYRTLRDIGVPKLYWDDFVRLSKTRLWFGLKDESFAIEGNTVLFAPVATRVYAASSDPLYPGKESEPNYQSGEFLGWWDRHYAAVADYEPYYHKLNQIQKWSCILMIMKEKRSRALDFLAQERVDGELDFEQWYNGAQDIKIKTAIPFIDRNKFNRKTECFRILQSQPYPIMGQSFFISGGVSLASRKDIAAKMKRASGGGGKPAGRPAPGGKTTSLKGAGKASASGKGAGRGTAAAPKKSNFGELAAKREGQVLKLEWNRGEGAALDESVSELAALQSADKEGARKESIFKKLSGAETVVRIEQGKTYLVKNRAVKDKWMYVSVNPAGKLAEYPAKASGTDPDSDIFCAKTVAPLQAEKLIAEKKGVTILP